MNTSSVPTFKTYLKTTLETALPALQVSYGYPGDVIERESVYIGDVTGTMEIPTLKAGRKRRDETYRVKVIFDVILPAGTCEEAEVQAFSYMESLEDALANNPGASGVTAATFGEFEAETIPAEEGAACRLIAYVNVWNRLL